MQVFSIFCDPSLEKKRLMQQYRKGVIAVFINNSKRLLICQRTDNKCWQFPQGGIDAKESPHDALYRETHEEIGVAEFDIIKNSKIFISYNFPEGLNYPITKKYKGQQQIWYLCKLKEGLYPDLKKASCDEFCSFSWQTPQFALGNIVSWKKSAYEEGLLSLGLI
jgi:putative (di)nucleoside polyphosphate hydrolase